MVRWHEIVEKVSAENKASILQVELSQIDALLRYLRTAPRIFVTGEGRSGLVMRMFAMRLTHLGCIAFVVGDVTTPAISAADLLVVCSGSGETQIPCLRAERASQLGATVVALCGRAGSRLERAAQLILLLPQPFPQEQTQRTIQFGGSRFEQSALLLCDMLAYMAMEEWGIDPTTMQARHANLE